MVHDLTQHPPLLQSLPKSEAQIACEAKGGRWDANTKTCIPKETTPPQPKPLPGEVILDAETGEPKGFINSKGEFIRAGREDIQNIVSKRQARLAPIEGGQVFAERVRLEDIEEQQRILQETGAPVRRELDPTLERGEAVPVVGPLFVKIKKLLRPLISFGPQPLGKGDPFFELQPEELTTLALSEIERREIERGLTDSEKFGSFVESLSLGGMSNFAAEKPSENIKTILRELKTQKTRATNAELKVKDGTWRIAYGEEVIDEIKNNIQRMESRMKLLLQDSPEFKFDSDGVNFIETKILETRERLFSAEINIISGAATDPSEIQVLIALQESIAAEDFEI